MMNYLEIDSNNTAVGGVYTLGVDETPPSNWKPLSGEATIGSTWDPLAGTWCTSTTYAELRAAAYPSLEEQADMQYWDAVNGTTTWVDAVAAVKAQYPKP